MIVKTRASIFEEGEGPELDVSAFAPKTAADSTAPPAEQVKAVSQTAHFSSREPASPTVTKPKAPVKRPPRVYRTGRNVQFNVKASQATVDSIYTITEQHEGWVLGYTLERAVQALQRELKSERSRPNAQPDEPRKT
jgi:hypothetical protein